MNRIKNVRKSAGLSQADFSAILNVHQTAISQWESGKTYPDIINLIRISDMFKVSIDYLLGREEPTEDKKDTEIMDLYESMNDKGKETAMNTIRALAAYPEMCENRDESKTKGA